MNAALMLVCLAGSNAVGQSDPNVFRAPNIQVRRYSTVENQKDYTYHQLLLGRIDFGTNILKPNNRADYGKPDVDFSRYPTTYFHPRGPLGVAMQKFNWFPGPLNTYHADVRLPASLIGMGTSPLSQLVDLWSEPPVAVLGMAAGTPAAYARPGQTMHFFERNPTIVKLSLPDDQKELYFHYLQDALKRGANIQVFEGLLRPTFAKQGGEDFYHLIDVECYVESVRTLDKDLMTREGMQMLMSKLVEDGVLCYHVSNRYYDLVPILASVADDLKLACLRGHDTAPWGGRMQGYSSEWVMIARKRLYLQHLKAPPGYDEAAKAKRFSDQPFWTVPTDIKAKYVWTDKGEKSYRGVYRADPDIMQLSELLHDIEGFLTEKVGINPRYVHEPLYPVHGAISAWSRTSAEALNKDASKEKK